ncbi:MAG: hypothetical protein QM714_07200 [Nocardioides sp.]|uniref:hypothetical protein n=1 Tax=Nocardioides sp. TaxID=35761 RepID=UPI0039E41AD8
MTGSRQPVDDWTDDQLSDLVRDAFASREALAEQAIHVSQAESSLHRRRWAVPLVAAGVSLATLAGAFLIGHLPQPRRSDPISTGSPSVTTSPSPDGLRTTADNRADALRLLDRTEASFRDRLAHAPGSPHSASVREMPTALSEPTMGIAGAVTSRSRVRFWLTRSSAHDLARWLVAHPPVGFAADGADEIGDPEAGIGESGGAQGHSYYVDFEQTTTDPTAPAAASALVQTATTPDGSGVRVTITGIWRPARPETSYLHDKVTRVDATRVDSQGQRSTITVSDPGTIAGLVEAYNALPGWPPSYHSCPLRIAPTYRLVFHQVDRIVVVGQPGYCDPVWKVRQQTSPESGLQRLGPILDDRVGDLTSLTSALFD